MRNDISAALFRPSRAASSSSLQYHHDDQHDRNDEFDAGATTTTAEEMDEQNYDDFVYVDDAVRDIILSISRSYKQREQRQQQKQQQQQQHQNAGESHPSFYEIVNVGTGVSTSIGKVRKIIDEQTRAVNQQRTDPQSRRGRRRQNQRHQRHRNTQRQGILRVDEGGDGEEIGPIGKRGGARRKSDSSNRMARNSTADSVAVASDVDGFAAVARETTSSSSSSFFFCADTTTSREMFYRHDDDDDETTNDGDDVVAAARRVSLNEGIRRMAEYYYDHDQRERQQRGQKGESHNNNTRAKVGLKNKGRQRRMLREDSGASDDQDNSSVTHQLRQQQQQLQAPEHQSELVRRFREDGIYLGGGESTRKRRRQEEEDRFNNDEESFIFEDEEGVFEMTVPRGGQPQNGERVGYNSIRRALPHGGVAGATDVDNIGEGGVAEDNSLDGGRSWRQRQGRRRAQALSSAGDEEEDDGYYDGMTVVEPHAGHKKVLVTGGAGFIGSHVADHLLGRGDDVVIVDEMNDYYNVSQKHSNLRLLLTKYGGTVVSSSETGVETRRGDDDGAAGDTGRLRIYFGDICNATLMEYIYEEERPQWICHMAARAGVRPSIRDPFVYIHSNIEGTSRLLELAARSRSTDHPVRNFVFASSSSVYGGSKSAYFSERDAVDRPISPYAASKKSCELLSYVYHHRYGINVTALRFFTVYGPRGRPDMAPYKFVDRISRGVEIQQYGDGSSSRDYTYIDDIVNGVVRALDRPHPYEIFNLGKGTGTRLSDFIGLVQRYTNRTARVQVLPDQPGDVPYTCADVRKAEKLLGYRSAVPFEEGIRRTVEWYQETFLPEKRREGRRHDGGRRPVSETIAEGTEGGGILGDGASRLAVARATGDEGKKILPGADAAAASPPFVGSAAVNFGSSKQRRGRNGGETTQKKKKGDGGGDAPEWKAGVTNRAASSSSREATEIPRLSGFVWSYRMFDSIRCFAFVQWLIVCSLIVARVGWKWHFSSADIGIRRSSPRGSPTRG